MKAEGVKGFRSAKYDPEVMGEFIVENLLGLEKAAQLTLKEKEAYKRNKYPLVMSFFKEHDLQPTLMNLRKNKASILALWSENTETEENFTGDPDKETGFSGWIMFLLFIFLLVVILKILS